MRQLCRVVLALLIAIATIAPAWSWGDNGHRVICEMAYRLLDKGTQSKVMELVGKYEHPDGDRYESYDVACVFPELARKKAAEYDRAVAEGKSGRAAELERWKRFSRFDPWHFVDVPRTARDVKASDCGDGCLFTGIAESSKQLTDASADSKAHAEALIFLGHWIGDLHQPLHVAYADDEHGESIIAEGFYGPYSLYEIWNRRMLDKRNREGDRIGPYVKELLKKLEATDHADWTGGDPVAWANESYHIATQPPFRYCRWADDSCIPLEGKLELTDAYRDEFEGVMEERLMRAAVRLAAHLESALNP
ncbi:MAG: S1/P1 nuclease [Acidobacteriota bacterium]|jgi:hypothetical protein